MWLGKKRLDLSTRTDTSSACYCCFRQFYVEVFEEAGVSVALTPMLSGLCEPLLVRLIQALKVEDYVPGMLVIEQGAASNGIIWIWNGSFEVLDTTGKFAVASLSEGLMLGENCLVKNAPKNCCSVRATTFGNALVLSTSNVGDVFTGYDRDLHRMMCIAQVRWPRFCAAVALSNVLEIASKSGDPIRSWIHEMSQVDEVFVDQTLIALQMEESQQASSTVVIRPPPSQKQSSYVDGQVESDQYKEAVVRPPSASGILKKPDAPKKQSEKRVIVTAGDFGNALPDAMACGPPALKKNCASTVVHGTNMGSGGAAGGRSPLAPKKTEYKAIEEDKDKDEDDYDLDESDDDDDDAEDEDEDQDEDEEEDADAAYQNTKADALQDRPAGGLMAVDASGEGGYEDYDVDHHRKEEIQKDLVHVVFEALAEASGRNRDVMLAVMKLCELQEQDEGFDTSISWLEAPDVWIEAERQHNEAFPTSKLTIQVVSASGLAQGFGLLEQPNAQVRISFSGTYYETLVAEKSRTPVWNEEFSWTGEKFSEDEEIRMSILDVRDAVNTVLIGTSDNMLGITSGREEEWMEETFEIVNKHGEAAGSIVVRIFYCPVRAAGDGLSLVDDFVNQAHVESRDKMTALLEQVYEKLEMIETSAYENKDSVTMDLQNTCKSIIHGRKRLQRPCVSMAKKMIRATLGDEKGEEFLAEAFGPDGDSEESDTGDCPADRLSIYLSVFLSVCLPVRLLRARPCIMSLLENV